MPFDLIRHDMLMTYQPIPPERVHGDAHDPVSIGREFASAAALAQASGFGPHSDGSGLWLRC